ncbi:MAG: HEAT repeat domain-containing protein, partial [Thaumarchaeota archaeon]|nr:HEAT repeat domain-containing protein [Nitrososphaerota archaeon]
TTLATTYYPDEASEEDFQTSYAAPQTNAVSLVAHELAHQWFGDLTTCVDWSQAWLNEGFATYFQGLYLEKTRGVDHFRWDLGLRAEQFLDEDALDYRRPIVEKSYVFPDDVFDYTTYEKGAWMLHELRYLMGDDAFFRGITEFLNANAFASVDTHDLRKAMEKASGLSLEEFFDQAFFKPGFPEFEVEYEWDDAGKTAAVRVKQTQKMESGTPAFKLPCDIVFYVEGKRMEWRVGLNGAEQAFAIKLPSMPSIVEFDPRRWLLKKVAFRKSLKLLLNQLESSEDASSRADAAKALGVSKADAAVAGLKKAAVKEQFWDVRASALRALGAIGTPAALEALLEVGLPGNRRERRGLAEALGFFRDKRARETLVELLESDASPYVRCEAALSLGKAWPEDILPVLKKAMGVHSPNETLAEACLDAMGSINDKEVGGIVADCLRYGKPTRVRIGALKAIKRRGALLDGELPKLKEVLLKDKEFRVRQYLVAKLVPAIGDRRFLESLGEAAKTDRDPRIRRRALEALHRMSDTREVSHEISVLKAQVEQLKGESKVRPQPASTS